MEITLCNKDMKRRAQIMFNFSVLNRRRTLKFVTGDLSASDVLSSGKLRETNKRLHEGPFFTTDIDESFSLRPLWCWK
jgi:hypothetical protein